MLSQTQAQSAAVAGTVLAAVANVIRPFSWRLSDREEKREREEQRKKRERKIGRELMFRSSALKVVGSNPTDLPLLGPPAPSKSFNP